VHAAMVAGVCALALLAAAVVPLDSPLLAAFACPLRSATSWPCLGCGCTHAFQFAVRGRVFLALRANPLGTLLAFAALIHVIWTALRLAGLPWAPKIELTVQVRLACAVALAANWLFVAWR